MKRKIALLALLAVFAAIAASGTIAYFTSETHAHNVITSGGIKVEIVEHSDGKPIEKDEDGTPIMPDSYKGVMPATSISKEVKVNNIQDKAWIRVKLGITVEGANHSDLDTKYIIPRFINGENHIPLDTLKTADNSFFKWIYVDGYWYYNEPVEKDAFTDVLFHEVYFDKDMGNAYQNCTVKIDVEAEAIQFANNELKEGDPITSVWGAPIVDAD